MIHVAVFKETSRFNPWIVCTQTLNYKYSPRLSGGIHELCSKVSLSEIYLRWCLATTLARPNMSYSQDLWKEFGSSGDDLFQDPWGETQDRNLHPESRHVEDEFGDLESAESRITNIISSMTINDPWKYAHSAPPSLDPGVHQFSPIGPREQLDHSLVDDIHPWMNEPSGIAPPKMGPEEVFTISLANTKFGAEVAEGAEERPFGYGVLFPPDEGDEWGDFVINSSPLNLEPTAANKNDVTRATKDVFPASNSQLDSFPTLKAKVSNAPSPTITVPKIPVATPAQDPPPSNVPPPSILLLLIVENFQSLLLEIKDIITLICSSKENQRQLDQESMREMSHRISMARAAARIIAGRKLRWKRDNHLSQSMKIGPANSGRAGGMKLTGIDKMENRREDGEAEEAVRTWKRHIGTLRTAVATANSRHPDLKLVLPEIFEKMPVRTAKPSEGALVAPKMCFLCGLKRDERIEKVDVKVEDSFGEWWIDHWGHVDCKTFWEEHKASLSHR